MIGLKRGIVELEDHNEEWENNANEVIKDIKEILKDYALSIEHIGSTAIKNIKAKPIIDIIVGVNKLEDIFLFINELKNKNIIYRVTKLQNQLLFVKGDFVNDTRTHHIHIVKYNSTEWNNYLFFKDYLNSNLKVAKEYENLKIELANKYKNDRDLYTKSKELFIHKILKEKNK